MVNKSIVFNPPKRKPAILSRRTKEFDPRNRNNSKLVTNLEIIIDIKKIITPDIKRIHPVPIGKKEERSMVKSI